MPDTNFDLAPPAADVDGLHAVPIDIQRISARLAFDGATQTATGDATIEFTMGAQDGSPIFDLRQTITGAFLNGTAIPVGQLAQHDFGGGAGAELRVCEPVLAAGSAHALQLTYDLAHPASSSAGSYQPALTWSAGPRLQLSFGFTDLGPGRYLDAWVPANLIFDQFEVALDLEITNTAIAHSLITNGAVTVLGPTHWSVAFPARSASLSTLLEIRASDTLVSQTDTVALPAPGPVVTIEAWKLTTSSMNLTTRINELKTFLITNATEAGPYIHGDRFVAFFVGGGMEYDGGTTTSTGPLEHETHHSWWGRGLKPASQNDAWWDEAWTVYVTDSLTPLAFNTADPPVELHSQNPWVRQTTFDAYGEGSRFFQGVAALMGDSLLRGAMAAFYQTRNHRPATTLDLESHLLCTAGLAELVDAFHRWVYGFGESGSDVDLWMRDEPTHTGAELWGGNFWNSPDLWVRRQDDNGTTHQNPARGRDNWFYARVRNSGSVAARHFMVTFAVKQFAGTQFVYPGDFLPCIAATGGFELGPGETKIVKAKWLAHLVPPAGAHGCLLASVQARGNHPAASPHVWEENALAQKNLTIVALPPGGWVIIPIAIGHWKLRAKALKLELRRPKGLAGLRASILYPQTTRPRAMAKDRLDCPGARPRRRGAGIWTSESPPPMVAAHFEQAKEEPIPRGSAVRFQVKSDTGFPMLIGLRLHLPDRLRTTTRPLLTQLVQLDAKQRTAGGVAIEIEVRK